jgi:uncharacterized protein YjiS (DUF1127 family)
MNRIEAQRWESAADAARAATSIPAEDVVGREPDRIGSAAPGLGARWRPLLREWRARSRRRRALAKIPARDLRDAGLSLEAVEHELAQPFWRPLGIERK